MFYYQGKGYKGHIVVHSHYAKMLIGLIGFECYINMGVAAGVAVCKFFEQATQTDNQTITNPTISLHIVVDTQSK